MKIDWAMIRSVAVKVSGVLDWLDIPGTDLDNWGHRALDLIISLIPDATLTGEEKHAKIVATLASEGLPASEGGALVKAEFKMAKKEHPEWFAGNANPDSERP